MATNFRFRDSQSFPPIVKNLIIINVLVWVAQITMDDQFGLTEKIMLWPVKLPEFKPYQVVTHMFAHADFLHIFFNMFSLWVFGRVLELRMGSRRFLLFYILCGLGAAATHMLIQYIRFETIIEQANTAYALGDELTAIRIIRQLGPALGASGAVMGVVIGFAYLYPNVELTGMLIQIPIKIKWLALMWVAADLFGGITNSGKDNIANFAHLGGALTGFLIVLFWNKNNRRTLY